MAWLVVDEEDWPCYVALKPSQDQGTRVGIDLSSYHEVVLHLEKFWVVSSPSSPTCFFLQLAGPVSSLTHSLWPFSNFIPSSLQWSEQNCSVLFSVWAYTVVYWVFVLFCSDCDTYRLYLMQVSVHR